MKIHQSFSLAALAGLAVLHPVVVVGKNLRIQSLPEEDRTSNDLDINLAAEEGLVHLRYLEELVGEDATYESLKEKEKVLKSEETQLEKKREKLYEELAKMADQLGEVQENMVTVAALKEETYTKAKLNAIKKKDTTFVADKKYEAEFPSDSEEEGEDEDEEEGETEEQKLEDEEADEEDSEVLDIELEGGEDEESGSETKEEEKGEDPEDEVDEEESGGVEEEEEDEENESEEEDPEDEAQEEESGGEEEEGDKSGIDTQKEEEGEDGRQLWNPFIGSEEEDGIRHERESGPSEEEEQHQGTSRQLWWRRKKKSRKQWGQGCSVFAKCAAGLSCHPFKHKCYHSPRRENEPCMAGYPCGPRLSCEAGSHKCRAYGKEGDSCHLTRPCQGGLKCEAGSHKCRAPGKVGEKCHATRPCGSGLNCQPGVHKCYNVPRRENQPCVAGYPCGAGLSCEAGTHICRRHGKIGDKCHATRPCERGLNCMPFKHICSPTDCVKRVWNTVKARLDPVKYIKQKFSIGSLFKSNKNAIEACPWLENHASAALMEFATTLTSCTGITAVPAVYAGVVKDVGVGKKTVKAITLGFDSTGLKGCFDTNCHGAGIGAGANIGGVVGIVLNGLSARNIEGDVTMIDFDVNFGPGIGFGMAFSGITPAAIEIATTVGGGFNLFSASKCNAKALKWGTTNKVTTKKQSSSGGRRPSVAVSKVGRKHCWYNKFPQKYSTFAQAAVACGRYGSKCHGIYDDACNGKGFYICKSSRLYPSGSSCVYRTQRKSGNKRTYRKPTKSRPKTFGRPMKSRPKKRVRKYSRKHCNWNKFSKMYRTMPQAAVACARMGSRCKGIYDTSCDGRGFYICKSHRLHYSKVSCVYK